MILGKFTLFCLAAKAVIKSGATNTAHANIKRMNAAHANQEIDYKKRSFY